MRIFYLDALVTCFYGVQICYERQTAKHLGYAVSHFDNPAAAQFAIDMLHNFKLHGRNIVVAPYRTKARDAAARQAAPLQCSQFAANEAVAVVMNLSKSAKWMYDFLT
jgi:RNA recognition motif-containing protein